MAAFYSLLHIPLPEPPTCTPPAALARLPGTLTRPELPPARGDAPGFARSEGLWRELWRKAIQTGSTRKTKLGPRSSKSIFLRPACSHRPCRGCLGALRSCGLHGLLPLARTPGPTLSCGFPERDSAEPRPGGGSCGPTAALETPSSAGSVRSGWGDGQGIGEPYCLVPPPRKAVTDTVRTDRLC